MKEIFELRERPSQQIKELRLLYEESPNIGVYKVFSQWPGYPGLDTYCRVISDNDLNVKAIDFDGGPIIGKGYLLDNDNEIIDITRDKITNEFLVKVKDNKI